MVGFLGRDASDKAVEEIEFVVAAAVYSYDEIVEVVASVSESGYPEPLVGDEVDGLCDAWQCDLYFGVVGPAVGIELAIVDGVDVGGAAAACRHDRCLREVERGAELFLLGECSHAGDAVEVAFAGRLVLREKPDGLDASDAIDAAGEALLLSGGVST